MSVDTVTSSIAERLRDCAAMLAALDDDHAEIENGRGYSKSDGSFGHALAATPVDAWSPQMTRAAWEMLRRYRAQLHDCGIEFDEIDEPVVCETSRVVRVVDVVDGLFTLRFSYDPALVDAVKRLPGRRWSAVDKLWTATASAALVEFVERHGFSTTAAARAALDNSASTPVSTSLGYVEQHGPSLLLHTRYDAALVAAVRSVPGRRWDSSTRVWVAPLSSIRPVRELAEQFGLEWRLGEDVPDVDPVTSPIVSVERVRNAALIVLRFEYDRDLISTVRDLPGAEWSRSLSAWTLPTSAALDVSEWAVAVDALVDSSAVTLLDDARAAVARIAASAAVDAELDVPGLGGDLLPFQRAGVVYALRALGYEPGDSGVWQRCSTSGNR